MTTETPRMPYIIAGICCTNCGKHVPIINNRGECTCGTSWTIDQPLMETKLYNSLPVTLRDQPSNPHSNVKSVHVGNKYVGLVHTMPEINHALQWSANGRTWFKCEDTINKAISELLDFTGYTSRFD